MRRAAIVVLAAAALLACGRKAPVIAPELVKPDPPTDVIASSIPEGIHLTWTRPTRYSGGQRMRDLGSFRVERANADDAEPRYARVGTVELLDQTRFRQERRLDWVDREVTPETRYVYRIRARTVDGYESVPSAPVTVRFVTPGAPAP